MQGPFSKNSIYYMSGASGPGVFRKIIIPDLNIEINENSKISDISYPDMVNRKTGECIFKYPYESIILSEEGVNDLKELKRYNDALLEAQQNLKNAINNFKNTKGGKEIESYINPTPPLSIRDLLKEEDEIGIKNDLIEKFSCKILKFEPKLTGYSNVEIDIELDKNHSLTIDKIKEFTTHGFVGSGSYCYDSKTGIIYDFGLYLKNGQKYPPHVFSDLNELREIEKQRMIALEKWDKNNN